MDRLLRVLRKFIDVRRRELEPALLFFGFWFVAIVVFQVLKPLKKGLFVEQFGAYTELFAKLANVAVALTAAIGFTLLYNRFGSRRLILGLCGLFIVLLLGFAGLLAQQPPWPGTTWAFYLFGDLWSTVWVATFWAYLNEMTRTEQSKRLYGLIGGGGVVGGLVGGLLVWQLVHPLGAPLLLGGCALGAAAMGLLVWRTERIAAHPGASIGRGSTDRLEVKGARGRGGAGDETRHRKPVAERFGPAVEGARLVAASRYLVAIVAIIFAYELVSQVLDYQYASEAEALEGARATQAFFGKVTTIVGVVSVVTQLFLVSFIIRQLGMTTALLVLPVAMGLASGAYLALPMLTTAAMLTISDNAFSYSIHQTARETLFVPTSVDVQYKARAFADMFVQRFGKGVAIGITLALGVLPVRYLSILALVVVVLWVLLAKYAGRRFEKLAMTRAEEDQSPKP